MVKKHFIVFAYYSAFLMFGKASNIHFQKETRYKMVASRQEEIPTTEILVDSVEQVWLDLDNLLC